MMIIYENSQSRSIVMLVRAMSGGGAQRDAIELANGLLAAGWPMLVATLDAEGPLRDFLAPSMPLLDLGGGKRLRMARAVPALTRMLRARQPAAIIASEAAGNCLAVVAVQLCPPALRPRIILREVAAPLAARRADPYWQNRLGYHLAPWLYPRADLVLSFTAGVRQELVEHFGVAPQRAINLGTNAVLSAARLAELIVPERREAGHIIAVGRLSREKDFAALIAAFAVLRDERMVRLTILGEGPERPALQRLVRQLGLDDCVMLLGFVAEPSDWVARVGLLVSSSRHEGFGNAIVEALACGTPVVATDAPHGPREILANGRFGLLVPPNNLHALVHAMRRALDAPVDRAALRARAASFTTEVAVSRMNAVLASLGLTPLPLPVREEVW
ncbi:glycosyltransferase [Devosia sp. A369]